MKIKVNVKRDDESGKRVRLSLPVPLSILKWRFIWRYVPEESRKYAQMAPQLADALQRYKKEYGSWDLVDVLTHDGDVVKIRV